MAIVNITTARCGGYWLLTAETTFIHIFFLPPPFLFHRTVIAFNLHFHYPSLSTSFFPFFLSLPFVHAYRYPGTGTATGVHHAQTKTHLYLSTFAPSFEAVLGISCVFIQAVPPCNYPFTVLNLTLTQLNRELRTQVSDTSKSAS